MMFLYKEYIKINKYKDPEYGKKYYQKNRERLLANARKQYNQDKQLAKYKYKKFLRDHPDFRLLQSSRNNARLSNLEHTLDRSHIIIPEKCPLLDIPLTNLPGKIDSNPSIDRIDPTKGYIPENIQIVSDLANRMKNSATKEQLLTFAKNVLKLYG